MMGPTHVLSGAAVGIGLLTAIDASLGRVLVGAAVVGGAALLPDLDQYSGTASRAWGPITRTIGSLTGRVCGGHRGGTHTLLAAVLAGVILHAALEAGLWVQVPVLALLVAMVLVAWEPLGLWDRWLWPINLGVSAGTAVLLVASGMDLRSWLPAAVTTGWVVHILGDALTRGGVPMFAPFSTERVRLTGLRTNGTVLGFRWEVGAQWAFGGAAIVMMVLGMR